MVLVWDTVVEVRITGASLEQIHSNRRKRDESA